MEDVDGVEDKVLRDATTVGLQMLLEAVLNMFLRAACSIDEALFLVKSQNSGVGTALFKCQFIRISVSWNVGFKKFYHIYIYIYTGCNRRNGPDFGRVFLRSNYTDITQNTSIQS